MRVWVEEVGLTLRHVYEKFSLAAVSVVSTFIERLECNLKYDTGLISLEMTFRWISR